MQQRSKQARGELKGALKSKHFLNLRVEEKNCSGNNFVLKACTLNVYTLRTKNLSRKMTVAVDYEAQKIAELPIIFQ